MSSLTHVDADGSARMVDVSSKALSLREAVATGRIRLKPATLALIAANQIAKGDVFATARIAGIQAAKQTAHLIPLCHTLMLTHVDLEISADEDVVNVECTARTTAQTGVEMEALTGVSVALLTIYDMCKAVDTDMEISHVRLVRKSKRDPVTR
ncbi:MAG TPA: cyclic pyranopterin monophosphate synthase MoaC [Chthoniobacterales bacterium]|nr:cyclic pyranopterin monophosphate synthase MoaC [Chthoniobacterales bacterium]